MYAYIIFCIIISSCASTMELQILSFSESFTGEIKQTVRPGNIRTDYTQYRDYTNNRQLTFVNSTSSPQIAYLISGGCLWGYFTLSRTCLLFQSRTNSLPERFFYLNYLTLSNLVNSIETWEGTVASNIAFVTVSVTVNANDRTTPLTITSLDSAGTVTHQEFVSWTGSPPASSVFVPPTNCHVCGSVPTSSTVSTGIASYTLLIVACLMMVLFIDKI